jgi:hypothetical protein
MSDDLYCDGVASPTLWLPAVDGWLSWDGCWFPMVAMLGAELRREMYIVMAQGRQVRYGRRRGSVAKDEVDQ